MPFQLQSRHTPREKIEKRFPGARVLDVTSRGEEPWVRFSPFYPLGGVPVPFSPGRFSQSVEGVWQGLKVFETAGIDESKFENRSMKRLKRTVRKFGRCLGHQKGLESDELLGYREARYAIYLPTYRWALTHPLAPLVEELRDLAAEQTVVLLDYERNSDPEDLSRPLSHAGLLIAHIEGQ